MNTESAIKNKRILMVISRFPPVIGGAEIQCLNLSASLVSAGHDVTVVTERFGSLKRSEVMKGVKVVRLYTFIESSRFLANIYFLINLSIYFLLNNSKFDIVHSHIGTASALFASMLAKFFGKKSIVKFAGSGRAGEVYTSSSNMMGRVKLALINMFTDVAVCPDNMIKEELVSSGFNSGKVKIIYNGVDTGYFCPSDKKKDDALKVLFVGRLDKVKNIGTLFKAWAIVDKDAKPELIIVGDGMQKEGLRHLAIDLKIADSVKFAGRNDDVRQYLQQSSVFVLPSMSEGFSNSLLEAMSSGLAVIASRVGGNRVIVDDKVNGCLFEPQDEKELSEKINTLLKDSVLRNKLGIEARKKVESMFSIAIVRDKYIELYNELWYKKTQV